MQKFLTKFLQPQVEIRYTNWEKNFGKIFAISSQDQTTKLGQVLIGRSEGFREHQKHQIAQRKIKIL